MISVKHFSLLVVVALLGAVPQGARAGYLHGPPYAPAPVVSYGYHTAVVSKPLPVPLPLHHVPLHPVLPPPIIVKPIATSYQSFHKVDHPVYPIVVKALPLHAPYHAPYAPYHPPLHAPYHAPPHPLPLPLSYGHHYPHYLR